MEIWGLLESAIGLVLIFLVLSLICSAWVEGIVSWTGLRGENLRELLKIQTGGDDKVANLLLAQPQLRSLFAPEERAGGRLGRVKGLAIYLVKRLAALFWDQGRCQKAGFRPPSYIPPPRFARALCELAVGESPERFANAAELLERRLSSESILEQMQRAREQTQDGLRGASSVVPPDMCNPNQETLKHAANHLSEVLTRLWVQSGGRSEKFLAEIERWFEDGTDRAAGWFKRSLAPKLFAVGVVVAIALNVDTLEILSRLSGDAELRQAIVQTAVERVESGRADTVDQGTQADFERQFKRAKQELLQMEPLLGWRSSSFPVDGPETEIADRHWIAWFVLKFIGLLVTAIALSLGAPFWFDVLQKLVRIRSSVSQADVEKRERQRVTGAGADSSASNGAAVPTPATGSLDDSSEQVRLGSGMVGLAPTADKPDRKNALWMAELASLAYEDRQAVERELKSLGLSLDEWLDGRELSLRDRLMAVDTQAYVASNQDLIVVAFRGTEVGFDNPADVLTDLQAWKSPVEGFDELPEGQRPRAHHGFVEALDAVQDDLWRTLKKLGTDNPGRAVWFVGHSLGGALAVLAASRYVIRRDVENHERSKRAEEWLKQLGDDADDAAVAEVHRKIRQEAPPLPPVRWIYTIGQPAVGDERLAAWLESRFGQRLVRTINNRDIVPRLPSPLIGYTHVGTELYFDSFGRMKLNPSGWYRSLDVLVIDPNKVRERAREAVGDHKSETYIGLLKGRGGLD